MGKHSAPSQFGSTLVKAGAVALAATTMPLLIVDSAEATPDSTGILEVIAKCESGNRNVNNNTVRGSTASGYLQILDSTWKAFGGSQFGARAIHASREEQFVVGARVLQGQGIDAWNPSRSCWGSKISTTKPKTTITPEPKRYKVAPSKKAKKITAKTQVQKPAPPIASTTKEVSKNAAASYLIKRGDTLSRIAQKHHSTVKRLATLNRDTVHNVDRIYAGKHLRLG